MSREPGADRRRALRARVRAALEELPYDFVAARRRRHGEAARGRGLRRRRRVRSPVRSRSTGRSRGRPLRRAVLGRAGGFGLASRVLAAGCRTSAPTSPAAVEPFPLPSIGIVGLASASARRRSPRTRRALRPRAARGRLAWGGAAARARGRDGRARRRRAARALARGRHAASDYLETAALAGVETIGCRHAGGGLTGAVSVSNVHEGPAGGARPDLVVFDGSGAAIPPVETAAASWSSTARPSGRRAGYLNEYRHLVSDLVVLTMAEEGPGWEGCTSGEPAGAA